MKSINVRIRVLLSVFLFSAILLLDSCDNEEPEVSPFANFSSDVQHLNEGTTGTFTLQFSKPAPQSGTVRINVSGNAVYGEHYTTNPLLEDGTAVIAVGKGNTTFHFTVFTYDNSFYENSKYISFTIEQIPVGIKHGVVASHTVIINDDEAPSLAEFEELYGMLNEENADGITVKIRLTQPVQGAGAIAIDLSQNAEPNLAVYGKHFTTIPAAIGNRIVLGAAQGDTLISFKIIPVDDALFEEDKAVQFQLTYFSGAVQKGNYTSCWIILRSDDTSEAAFDKDNVTVNEDDSQGVVVKVTLSEPIPIESRINTFAGSIPYGLNFVTDPKMQVTDALECDPVTDECYNVKFYFIPLIFFPNSKSVEFRIIPVDNQLKDGSRAYSFSLDPLPPYITTSNNLTLTILDDD